MARGDGQQTRVHFKGQSEDFIVFAESAQAVKDWKKDSSIPLAQVADSFKIFVTHGQGAQGVLDAASNQTLEAEFGTSNEDEVVKQILQKGQIQETEGRERVGNRNQTDGSLVAH